MLKKRVEIKSHLVSSFPLLSTYTEKAPLQELLIQNNIKVGDAVTKVVTGQMLSRTAASTIYQRLIAYTNKRNLTGTWELAPNALLSCGLSRAKCKTILEFAKKYTSNPDDIENWSQLSSDDLLKQVRSYWGMSDWTASILAIFYFGHEDVFPHKDSSIIRALSRVDCSPEQFNPLPATPYRSYLALYLWSILDKNITNK